LTALLWFGSPEMKRRLVRLVPGFAAMQRATAIARFCQTLGLLREGELPLPDSLRIAGEAAQDEPLRQAGERMAEQVEAGYSLVEVAEAETILPRDLIPLLRGSEGGSTFSEALI